MAHEIENANDFGYSAAGGEPWHIGMTGCKAFPGGGCVTPHEAQKLILPWSVEECPLTTPQGIVVPDMKGMVRSDTLRYLGTVTKGRTTLQNDDVAEILTRIFGDVNCIETVGALRGGEKTFFLVKLGTPIEVTPGDIVQRYFLCYNPHDGSGSVRMRIVNIRVVCANTLRMALGENTREFTVRHNESVKQATETAARLLLAEEADRATTATFLAATRERQMSKSEWTGLLDEIQPLTFKTLSPQGAAGPLETTGRSKNRREFLSALFYDAAAEQSYWDGENGRMDTISHTLDGADLDGGQTAYRALQVASQDADRSRTVQKGTDRKVQNLFGEGAGSVAVEKTVKYLSQLVGVN